MPLNPDGTSVFDEVIKAGRIKIVKRTEGISTTDLVGRMLLMTRTHHVIHSPNINSNQKALNSSSRSIENLLTQQSPLLPTTHRLIQFSGNAASRIQSENKVIYVDGHFDLFHVGHVELLKKMKELGDFVLVGIHEDQVVNQYYGKNYPIMNLYERVLNVLSCKYVDEVIIGAPWFISKDMTITMNISLVVECKNFKVKEENEDRFSVPKGMGKYQEVELKTNLTTEEILRRIIGNREQFEKKFEIREKKEKAYVASRQFVVEL